jgi:hypothetical protein
MKSGFFAFGILYCMWLSLNTVRVNENFTVYENVRPEWWILFILCEREVCVSSTVGDR